MTEEKWLPVVGHEGLYEVSDHGRVRSLDRTSADGVPRKGQELKTRGLRYQSVRLSRNGTKKQLNVHRLVLIAFAGPAPTGTVGCHRDDDAKNNSLENLYWGTYSENWADSIVNGRRSTRGRRSAITESDVAFIRSRCSSGETQRSVATAFGLDPSAISLIVGRKRWANVPE